MEMRTIDTRQPPDRAEVASPSRADVHTTKETAPGPTDLGELKVGDASVIQVRLERALEGDRLDAGQELTGRLESDLLGPDGEILVPAGAVISATVGAEQTWQSAPAGGLQLQLVGTTTQAADLFGTVDEGPTVDEGSTVDDPQAPSLHLTGDLVELGSDSVLTFQLRELSDQPADMRVLTTATAVWMEAFNKRDAVTIAGLWSEDGALLPPNGRAVIGRDAIYAYWKNLLGESTNHLELINVETVVEGDLGYKAGRFELLDQSTGKTVDRGKYMQIWKRSPTGYWELHRDMWNSNTPVGSS
jgi:ketosteroid isomerase-like protein